MQKLCPEAWEKYTEGLMGGKKKKDTMLKDKCP